MYGLADGGNVAAGGDPLMVSAPFNARRDANFFSSSSMLELVEELSDVA